nr:RecName: Full=Adenosine deaminase 2 [Gallus gallus]
TPLWSLMQDLMM